MRRRPLQLTTMFGAAIIFAAQSLPLCSCTAATKGGATCASSCCGERSKVDAGGVRECRCTATWQSIRAPASETSQRIHVPSTPDFIQPVAAWTAHLGLHGVHWQTAFDLMTDGAPPGLRLHALFSVWRN
jgi:hypothetical protein